MLKEILLKQEIIIIYISKLMIVSKNIIAAYKRSRTINVYKFVVQLFKKNYYKYDTTIQTC